MPPARVPSDHPTVTAVRGTLESLGAIGRPMVRIDAADADRFPADSTVRLAVGGRDRFTRIEDRDGDRALVGAFDNARLATAPGEGVDRLAEWVEAASLEVGRSLLVDVVTDGTYYGLRVPGTTTIYQPIEPPRASLRAIADRVTEE